MLPGPRLAPEFKVSPATFTNGLTQKLKLSSFSWSTWLWKRLLLRMPMLREGEPWRRQWQCKLTHHHVQVQCL
jgi:hypothetical protein